MRVALQHHRLTGVQSHASLNGPVPIACEPSSDPYACNEFLGPDPATLVGDDLQEIRAVGCVRVMRTVESSTPLDAIDTLFDDAPVRRGGIVRVGPYHPVLEEPDDLVTRSPACRWR